MRRAIRAALPDRSSRVWSKSGIEPRFRPEDGWLKTLREFRNDVVHGGFADLDVRRTRRKPTNTSAILPAPRLSHLFRGGPDDAGEGRRTLEVVAVPQEGKEDTEGAGGAKPQAAVRRAEQR